jgi:hypothetical protein
MAVTWHLERYLAGTIGSGTIASTVTLIGGNAEYDGRKIGDRALIGTLNFQAGTLSNVLELLPAAWADETTRHAQSHGHEYFHRAQANGTLNFQPSATYDLVETLPWRFHHVGSSRFQHPARQLPPPARRAGSSTGSTVNMTLADHTAAR